MGDRVGVAGLGDDPHLVARQHFQDRRVVALHTDHVLLEELEGKDAAQAGDHVDPRLRRAALVEDQRAGILRPEGIADAQRDAGLTQTLGRTGMDRLHAHVGELVGHIVIGPADDADLVEADRLRIGAAEVELLVDHRLARLGQRRHAGEGHLGVAAVMALHQRLLALGIARQDRHLGGEIDVFERRADAFVERRLAVVAPARQIHEAGIDAAVAQEKRRDHRRMGLAERRDHLADGHQVLFETELAEGAETAQVDQAAADSLDPLAHEIVRGPAVAGVVEDLGVDRLHVAADGGEGVAPGPFGIGAGEQRVHARLAGLLVLEQLVGDAAIGGDDENPVVEIVTLAAADQDILQQFLMPKHGCSADFLDCMVGHGSLSGQCLGCVCRVGRAFGRIAVRLVAPRRLAASAQGSERIGRRKAARIAGPRSPRLRERRRRSRRALPCRSAAD